VDPVYGPVRAISGTSMSTPKFAFTIAMLAQFFGVTKIGKDLDNIVKAVMDTLESVEGQQDWAIGQGFSVAYEAYKKLKEQGMKERRSGWLARFALRLVS